MKRSLATFLFAASSLAWAQFQPAGPDWQQQQQAQQYPPRVTPADYPAYGAGDSQPPNEVAEAPDPNDQQHGVARLSIAQGDVSVRRGDNGQLTAAIANAPLLARDRIQTAPGSRAEIQIDYASVVRLGPDTDLGLANATYQRYQMQLGIGSIIVRVLRDTQTQLEIDTPSVAFRPLGQGDYRISVYDNGTTQVTVRAGRIEMAGPRGSQMVNAGQSLLVRGDSGDPEFQNAYPPQPDQLDDWSAGRDNELLSSRSYQYVSPEITGAQDLDRYGNWVPSQYGQVWAPRDESADWSPYSNGQWAYEDYYGWTWIGYEPWGWAPYHYGRWFWNTGYGWCWWPGGRFGVHYGWSPALVSFFGFGGGLGWVSLAPFEVYHPWWGRWGYGFNRFGHYDVGRFYRNAGIRGGALTASLGAFAGAGHRYAIASRSQLTGAEAWRGRLPMTPSSNSYRFSERPAFANQRLSQAANRSFFNRPQTLSRQTTPQYNNAPRAMTNGGWQRFGAPGGATTARQPQSFVRSGNESGWHNFGQPSAPRYNYSAPTPRYNYSAPTPRYNYSAPAPRYNAPAMPHYSTPAAPRYSAPAPSYHGGGGGGGNRSGGGGGHSGGGGGGGGHGGGGHHGR